MDDLRKKIDQYVNFNKAEWERVTSLFTETKVKKGTLWVEMNKKTTQFAFVKDGVLRHFFLLENGKEYNKNFFWKSEFAGVLSSLISKKESVSNIEALTDCTLLVADYDEFTSLFKEFPKVETFIRKILEEYFIYYEQNQYDLVTLTAKERYLKLLEFYPPIEKYVPQYQIASYLGITPVQFSRIKSSKLT